MTPAIGSRWTHRNGNTYEVVLFTNQPGDRPNYPVTIVYKNVKNGLFYSRRLDDWHRSMTEVSAP